MSAAGAQLTLWRIRSQLLYYRKHHGLLTTWLVAAQERWWHQLRAFKNRHAVDGPGKAKHEDSLRIARLFEQAWEETKGGQVSPPRPW